MSSARDIRPSLFTGRMAAFLGLLVVSALLITVFAYRVRSVSWKGGMQPEIVTGASQDVLMQAGLDLLYTRRDPAAAAVEFRKVLALNPAHYGATYQLAVALDQAGKPAEARPLWEQALRMSEGYNDKETADTARARLQKEP